MAAEGVAPVDGDGDGLVRRAIFHGVVQKVQQDLAQGAAVDRDLDVVAHLTSVTSERPERASGANASISSPASLARRVGTGDRCCVPRSEREK